MGLTLLSLWLDVQRFFSAPLRYFERRARARRDHELALAQLQADAQVAAQKVTAEMFAAVVKEMSLATQAQAQASAAQSQVWTTWLEQFTKVTEATSTTTITEADEAEWEDEEEDARRRAPRGGLLESLNAPFAATGRLAPPIDPFMGLNVSDN